MVIITFVLFLSTLWWNHWNYQLTLMITTTKAAFLSDSKLFLFNYFFLYFWANEVFSYIGSRDWGVLVFEWWIFAFRIELWIKYDDNLSSLWFWWRKLAFPIILQLMNFETRKYMVQVLELKLFLTILRSRRSCVRLLAIGREVINVSITNLNPFTTVPAPCLLANSLMWRFWL